MFAFGILFFIAILLEVMANKKDVKINVWLLTLCFYCILGLLAYHYRDNLY